MGRESFNQFKPDPQNKRALDEEKERLTLEFHSRESLHDEEGATGIDLTTGITKKTEKVDGADEKSEVRIKTDKSADLMGKLKERNDEAARWLAENDPELKKKKKAA